MGIVLDAEGEGRAVAHYFMVGCTPQVEQAEKMVYMKANLPIDEEADDGVQLQMDTVL